jgi:hypothetical protein
MIQNKNQGILNPNSGNTIAEEGESETSKGKTTPSPMTMAINEEMVKLLADAQAKKDRAANAEAYYNESLKAGIFDRMGEANKKLKEEMEARGTPNSSDSDIAAYEASQKLAKLLGVSKHKGEVDNSKSKINQINKKYEKDSKK